MNPVPRAVDLIMAEKRRARKLIACPGCGVPIEARRKHCGPCSGELVLQARRDSARRRNERLRATNKDSHAETRRRGTPQPLCASAPPREIF